MNTENLYGVGSRLRHPAFGDGVVIALHKAAYDIVFMKYGVKTVGKEYAQFEVIEHLPAESSVSFTEMEKSLARVLRAHSDVSEVVQLGEKWDDGMMILQPKDKTLSNKEIPIETFFHKIVMLRDRLRVMEQRINASKNLSDEEKINLQQYLTRIYGSLTTFNVLFKKKEDHFVGERGKVTA